MLEHSPLLLDADLVDAVATGSSSTRMAIANRSDLPRSVSAAIAEVGCAEACLVLIENPRAAIATLSLDRIVARLGHLGAIRDAMLERDDLPAASPGLSRQALSNPRGFCGFPGMAGAGSCPAGSPGMRAKG